jgi:hypothetical protein
MPLGMGLMADLSSFDAFCRRDPHAILEFNHTHFEFCPIKALKRQADAVRNSR